MPRNGFLSLISTLTVMVALSFGGASVAAAQAPPPPEASSEPPPGPPPEQLSPEQLQQLVAPIALYPDSLVAQILAAATYPTQIVEAERFLEQNQGLQGEALANAVDAQEWAPSVKALTAFPQVLSDMNQNLSWTSELGDVNYNQSGDVMNAIQVLREQAQQAGTLQSTEQQSVADVNGNINIAPTNPDEVYVPEYDPEYVYGGPIGLWPGLYPWWSGGGAYITFGYGVPMRSWYGRPWGWRHWGLGWGERAGIWYDRDRWHSESRGFYDRRDFDRGDYRGHGFEQGRYYGGRDGYEGRRGYEVRNGFEGRGGGVYTTPRPGMHSGYNGTYSVGNRRGEMRGYGHANPGMHSGASGGVIRGGEARGYGSRGQSSMGGGFHGSGGGFHGGEGGGHAGGHH